MLRMLQKLGESLTGLHGISTFNSSEVILEPMDMLLDGYNDINIAIYQLSASLPGLQR